MKTFFFNMDCWTQWLQCLNQVGLYYWTRDLKIINHWYNKCKYCHVIKYCMSPSTISWVFKIPKTSITTMSKEGMKLFFLSDLQWDLWRPLWTGSVKCRSSFGTSPCPGHGATSERCGLSDWLFLCYHWCPRWQPHHQTHICPLYQWPNRTWMQIKYCGIIYKQLAGGFHGM